MIHVISILTTTAVINIHHRKECSYRSMWDLHDPQNEKRTSLCDIWQTAYKLSPKEANKKVAPFKFAYNHASYIVFKID